MSTPGDPNRDFHRMIEQATREVESSLGDLVDTEHLLLALLKDPAVADVLAEYGVTYDTFGDAYRSIFENAMAVQAGRSASGGRPGASLHQFSPKAIEAMGDALHGTRVSALELAARVIETRGLATGILLSISSPTSRGDGSVPDDIAADLRSLGGPATH